MRRASWMSLGMMVTRLAWMAQRLVSSKRPTRYASDASWRARMAEDWKRRSVLKSSEQGQKCIDRRVKRCHLPSPQDTRGFKF